MQLHDLIQRRFVERAAHQPAFLAITAKVALPKIFQPDQTFLSIVKINLGHPNSVLGEKVRDRYVMAIFFPLPIVFYQNERLVC